MKKKLTPETCQHEKGFYRTDDKVNHVVTFQCVKGCGFWSTLDMSNGRVRGYVNKDEKHD